jgi:uncharacterized protein with PhoU and TrkA domain
VWFVCSLAELQAELDQAVDELNYQLRLKQELHTKREEFKEKHRSVVQVIVFSVCVNAKASMGQVS